MDRLTEIHSDLYNDEVVCFLADRYHTNPTGIIKCFLSQDGIASDRGNGDESFRLEDNEMEILRGLTSGIQI